MWAAGLAMQTVGAFYAIDAQKGQLRAQASQLRHQGTMAGINASIAEGEAAFRRHIAQRRAGRVGLRYAQIKASARSSMAGRGVRLGSGNAAEVLASIELAKEEDLIAINLNSVRETNAIRFGAFNERGRAGALNLGAGNLDRTAGTLNPFVSALSTGLAGGSRLASQVARDQRAERFFASRSA